MQLDELSRSIHLVPKLGIIEIATYHVSDFRYFCFGAHFVKMMRNGGCGQHQQ